MVVCASPAAYLLCGSGGFARQEAPGGALSAYRRLVSCNSLFGVVCAWRGVAGFKVASSPRVVREKVRPARSKHSTFVVSTPAGRVFRENAAGVPLLGELCRARGRMCLVLGACCRAQGAGVFFYVTGVLRWFQSDCGTGIFVHVAATLTRPSV